MLFMCAPSFFFLSSALCFNISASWPVYCGETDTHRTEKLRGGLPDLILTSYVTVSAIKVLITLKLCL